jgi:hypothetical protein
MTLLWSSTIDTRCTFAEAERVGDEAHRVVRELDDVDLLAAQLADDRLHARALHPDARADRIDVTLARVDGHFRAIPACAGAADHHGAVVSRHFCSNSDEQRRVGARQRSAGPWPSGSRP